MISGNIHEKSNLAVLPEPLQRAVQFLKDNDLAAHEPGKFELDGDKMILQVIDQSTGPRENLRPECHRKYIDVQFLAAGGPERIGWYPDLGDNEVDENPDRPRRCHRDAARQLCYVLPLGCTHPGHPGRGDCQDPQNRHQGRTGHLPVT